jgi:ubiquinone/menaquinone biosynthesis C-methylase UbiE
MRAKSAEAWRLDKKRELDTQHMEPYDKEHNERILDQFTRQAEPFALAPAHSAEDSLRLLMTSVEVKPTDEVLDVACGPGIISCELASVARHVTGIDMVPAMLEQARKRQNEKGLNNVQWRLGDAEHLPYEDQSFSLVVTRYSFHHLLNPDLVLREMVRVCRSGGRVAVVDVTPDEGKANAYDDLEKLRDPSHTRALTLTQLKELGARHSLSLVKTANYRVDVAVDALLKDSFPPPGNAEKVRRMVREDIGVNRLSMDAYQRDGELRFYFPTSIVVWTKTV